MAILVSPAGFATRRRSSRHLHPLLSANETKKGPLTRSKTGVNFEALPEFIEGKRRRSSRLTGYESPPLSATSSPESYKGSDKEYEHKEYENLKISLKVHKKKRDESNFKKELRSRKKRKIEQSIDETGDSVTESSFNEQSNSILPEEPIYQSNIEDKPIEFESIKGTKDLKDVGVSNPLDENIDYITLSSTLNLLYNQRDKIKNDILQLNRLKKKYNGDPSHLINLLNHKNNDDFLPKRDRIIRCPSINLKKYGILDNENSFVLSAVNNQPLLQSTNLLK